MTIDPSILAAAAAKVRSLREDICRGVREAIIRTCNAYGIRHVDCGILYSKLSYQTVTVPYCSDGNVTPCSVREVVLDGNYLDVTLYNPCGFEHDACITDIPGGESALLFLFSEIEKDIIGGYLRVEDGSITVQETIPEAEDGDYTALAEDDETVVEMILRDSETCRRTMVRGILMDYRCGDEIDGLHRYEVRHADDDICRPCTVENSVIVNHYGTFYTKAALTIKKGEWFDIVRWGVLSGN